jgi:hypothetical protein
LYVKLNAVSVSFTVIHKVYVDRDAPGPLHDGSSWTSAFLAVQEGLDAAAAGDQVWVAGGTYPERIVLKAGVALFGGFAGTEFLLSQRNWRTNITILDGGAGYDELGIGGATVEGNCSLKGGADDNSMNIWSTEEGPLGITPTSIHGDLNVTGGSGADDFSCTDCGVAGKTTVSLGAGDNVVYFSDGTDNTGLTKVTTGGGADDIHFESDAHFSGGLTVSSGGEYDVVTFDSAQVDGPVSVKLGASDDDLYVVNNCIFGSTLLAYGGAGWNSLYHTPDNVFATEPRAWNFADYPL